MQINNIKNKEEIKILFNKSKSSFIGRWPQRYKSYNLQIKENKELKAHLEIDGFFNFNIRNKGYIVYEHQIIAFYFCGGINAFKRGLICDSNIIEIHHIDGNTFNNSSSNLVYLPRVLHNEITTIQRRSFCKYLKDFRRENGAALSSKLLHIQFWNKQGRLIKGVFDFIYTVLMKTLFNSAAHFNITINYTTLKQWIKQTVKNIKSFFPIYHLPLTWIT